jgi:pimeloyl-ACP methyl ester carboxylesterase/DNA-binding CsgD family transcriptional regulator
MCEKMAGVGHRQEIRFCAVGDARVAYATVGSGPPLLLPASFIGHLEVEWDFAELRDFIGALARDRTVIRYDRLGTGLSDRTGPHEFSVDAETETVAALANELGLDTLSLLGISWGGSTAVVFAARHPERVRALALVGGYANGRGIAPQALRESMVATVEAHWGAGSRMLADVWLPHADAAMRERFAKLQRAAATPEVAAATLAAVYRTDIRPLLPQVRAPALVVHRRNDRAMPFEQGRELAALLPHARLVALDGDLHPPWLGDSAAVLTAVDAFLAERDPTRAPSGPGPLSEREREVLRLVAEGLSDAEIARRLIVSPHTVHRHVANIRAKLGQPSRAAAAAHAARTGLI